MWWEFSPLKELCWNKEFRTCFRVKWFGFPKPFPRAKIGIHLQDMFNRHHGSISVIFQLIFNGISQKISLCHQDSSAPNAPFKLGALSSLARRGCSSLSPSMLGAPRDGFLPWNFGCLDDFSMTYASNWGLKKMGCGCNSQWIFLILSKDHPPDDSWCLPCAIVMVPWFYFETFWISLNREAHIQPFKCGMTIL